MTTKEQRMTRKGFGLALLAFLLSLNQFSQATHVRGSTRVLTDETTAQRRLNAVNDVLNNLLTVIGPSLNGQVADILGQSFDPLPLGGLFVQELDDLAVNFTDFNFTGFNISTPCNATSAAANITYDIGTMSGLSSIDILSLELVPNSQDIDVSFLGLNGADWSGNWALEAAFSSLSAATSVTLVTDVCGMEYEETLEGIVPLSDALLNMEMFMKGDTDNLVRFRASSEVTSADIENFLFSYDSLDTSSLGSFEIAPDFDLNEAFVLLLEYYLSGSEFLDSIQSGLDGELPISL